ncbi:hypothetical protein LXL04_023655 [Taraxacum kok-saghyz]
MALPALFNHHSIPPARFNQFPNLDRFVLTGRRGFNHPTEIERVSKRVEHVMPIVTGHEREELEAECTPRSSVDPKGHYKKGDSRLNTFPNIFSGWDGCGFRPPPARHRRTCLPSQPLFSRLTTTISWSTTGFTTLCHRRNSVSRGGVESRMEVAGIATFRLCCHGDG